MTSARPDTWMPFYWGDYLKDTMHLRPEGHGAYLLLIGAYWTSGEPLQDDDETLAAIARLDTSAWQRLRPTLARFFKVGGGVWRHGRIDHELQRAENLTKAKQEAGRRGGKSKANAKQKYSTATSKPLADSVANAKRTATPSQSPSPVNNSPPSEGADAPFDPVEELPSFLKRKTNGHAEPSLKDRVWGPCLQWLADRTGKKPDTLRTLVGKWVSEYGEGKTLEAIESAERNAPIEPRAYIEKLLGGEKLRFDHL